VSKYEACFILWWFMLCIQNNSMNLKLKGYTCMMLLINEKIRRVFNPRLLFQRCVSNYTRINFVNTTTYIKGLDEYYEERLLHQIIAWTTPKMKCINSNMVGINVFILLLFPWKNIDDDHEYLKSLPLISMKQRFW